MSKIRQTQMLQRHDPGQAQPARWTRAAGETRHSPVYDVTFEPADTFRLSEITAPLYRNKGKIIVCGILGVALGVAIGVWTSPTYRARTSLQLEDFRDVPLLDTSTAPSAVLPGTSVENYLQNQVKLLESETLARRVGDALGIQPKKAASDSVLASLATGLREYMSFLPRAENDPEKRRIAAVKDALTVRTSLQSQVIEVFFDASTPQLAAAGANEAASQFISLNREARSEMTAEATAWLRQQAGDLQAKLEADNQRLQNFAASAGLVFAGKDDTLAQDRMRQLQQALVQAEAERAAKQSRFDTVSKSDKARFSDASGDPIQKYEADLQEMRRQLSEFRTIYTPNHPKLIALEAQIQEMESAIRKAREDVVARVRSEYVAAAELERMLSESQKRQLETIEHQMNQQRHYDVMKSEVDTTQRLYESVLEKLKAAGAASSLRSTNVRVIDAATAPSAPYSPNFPFNAAVGLALGTLTGIGLALLRGRSDKVGRPGETVLFDVPELGVIPSAQRSWSGQAAGGMLPFRRKTDPGLVTWTHDSSPLSESFRATLNSILFGAFMSGGENAHPRQHAGRVLTVTSFDPMAGKTTVLSNLAVASAERKLRVLVIDADLRRPRIHSLFNLANDWGLSDVLEQSQVGDFLEKAPLEALVRSTHVPNLWVLPAGPGNAAIPSLLYSAGMQALLQRLRNEFDLVYVDSPPTMLYSDARLLGRLSDGLVMVVRANTRSREELRSVYARLIADRIRVLGTVLNAWEMDAHQSREYRAYYYRYQQPADRPA